MKATYDPEADALYIQFRDTTVTTKHLTETIAIDLDSRGKIAGIEILDAARQLGNPSALKNLRLIKTGPRTGSRKS